MHAQPDATIIIPAHNEEEELALLLQETSRALEGKITARIIVVDDGSEDGTEIVAKELGADVLSLQRTHGYGYALRAGLRDATGSVVVFLDADGGYDPAEIPKLVDLILKEKADFVMASRYLKPRRKMSLMLRIGNFLLALSVRMILGVKVTDFNTGLKAIRRSVINDFDLKENESTINIELVTQAVKREKKIVEIPTTHRMRFPTRAKKLLDGFRILRSLLRESFP